ncbi:LysR family transcriptional regulator [Alloiococcus otitis]|nr:LysR family transcriptional regulator [Alloiococcus otitis]
MDIKQLRYFIEVAETKNLSRAAENLNISQPTLSLSMKKIEHDLNVDLFDKKARYVLTKPGEILYRRGLTIVKDFDDLIREVSNYDEKINKSFKLGVTMLFAVIFMKEISAFITKHPSINLNIVQGGSLSLQEKLLDDDIDVGILSYPNYYPNEIEIQTVKTACKEYQVSVVMSESHPLAQKDRLRFQDLKDYEFSSFSDHFTVGNFLKNRSKELGFKAKIVFTNDDLYAILDHIASKKSLCLLPQGYQKWVDDPNLKWIPLDDDSNHFSVGVARSRKHADSEILDDFIKEMTGQAQLIK